ncbi:MAG: hypothetical protein ACRDBM_03615 [Sporomusa sp.]
MVGIELPSSPMFDAWQAYVETLGKPMDDIFLCDHVTGASYVAGMNIYGTQGAADSIAAGSTYSTTEGLYESFDPDFHGGSEMAYINKVVSGTVTVEGIEFNLTDAIANAFAADGIVMPPESTTYRGQEAVKDNYEGVFSAVSLDLQFTIDEGCWTVITASFVQLLTEQQRL